MYLQLSELIPLNTTAQWSLKLDTMMPNEDAAVGPQHLIEVEMETLLPP